MEINKQNTDQIPCIDIEKEDPSLIGKTVFKKSLNPFKSGIKTATIKGFVINEQTQRLAFTFEEDDSNVECWRCKLLPEA